MNSNTIETILLSHARWVAHGVTECLDVIQAKQAIESLTTEARIDELSHIQLDYGNRIAQTFVDGQAMTVEKRIAELQQQLEKGQHD